MIQWTPNPRAMLDYLWPGTARRLDRIERLLVLVHQTTQRNEARMSELSGAVGRLDEAVAALSERIGQLDTGPLLAKIDELQAKVTELTAAAADDEANRDEVARLGAEVESLTAEARDAAASIDAEVSEIAQLAPSASGGPVNPDAPVPGEQPPADPEPEGFGGGFSDR